MSLMSAWRWAGLLAVLLLAYTPPVHAEEALQDKFLNVYMLIREAGKLEEANQKASARKRYEIALKQLEQFPRKWNPAIIGYRKKLCESKIKELAGAQDAIDGGAGDIVPPLPDDLPQPEVDDVMVVEEKGTEQVPVVDTAEMDQLKAQVASLETDLNDTRNRLDATIAERDRLRVELAAATSELAKVKTDNTEDKVAELLRENQQLKEQLASAETQIQSMADDTDAESNIAMLNARLEKVRDQLAAQQTLNKSFEEATADLKQKLEEAQRELMLARQSAQEATGGDEAMDKENQMLRDIVQRQLQEQARRDIAKKLAQEELDNLKVKSETLMQQIDVLGSPLVELSEQELAMLRMSDPEIVPTANAFEAPLNPVQQTVDDAALASDDGELPAVDIGVESGTTVMEDSVTEVAENVSDAAADATNDAMDAAMDATEGVVAVADEVSSDTALPVEEEVLVASDAADVASQPRVPEDVRPLAQRASELYANGRFDEAADYYEQIIERYPESLYAWSNLGVVRYQQKRYDDASMALQQAVKLSPSDGFSYSILGIVYYQTGQLEEAIKALTRAKALDPNNAKTRNYLGIAAAQKGWQESAEKELRKAVEIAPNYGDAHFNLAVIYATQKPPSKELARKHYRTATGLGVPPDKQLERLLN